MTARMRLTPETQVDLLLKIAHRVKGTFDLDEIFNHLLETIRPVVAYDAAGIFLLKRDGLAFGHGPREHLIAGVAKVGFREAVPQRDPMLSEGMGIVGHVIRTGEVALVHDVRRDPRYVEGRSETRSEVAVPIFREGEPVGALNLESDSPSAFDPLDVEALRFFADAASIGMEKAMLHRQILDKLRIEEQLHLAREVQARLLPSSAPTVPGYGLAGIYLPSSELGGDYYDFLDLPSGCLGLVVADVSGKGIPAALIMAAFRTLVRTLGHHESEPMALAAALNHTLVESVAESAFVTSVYGVLQPDTGRFEYANCGHNPPIHLRSDGRYELLPSTGPLLGILLEAQFQMGSSDLAPGDLLVLYTDGVVECTSDDGEEFGIGRLAEILARVMHLGPEEVIREVEAATKAFVAGQDYRDDFTMVVLKRETGGSREIALPLGPGDSRPGRTQ